MSLTFDRILIEVVDLVAAIADYQRLMGVQAVTVDRDHQAAFWPLFNTTIELREQSRTKSGIAGLAFATERLSARQQGAEQPVNNALGLDIRLTDGLATERLRRQQSSPPAFAVDHVVLRTDNADACVDLFADQLSVRLALDKTVPEWGGRMLFFRSGKLTLEVIESEMDDVSRNEFWGIAYQCVNIDQTAAELVERGVTLSKIRPGRKPGTRVATLKSHDLGIPTLLIEPAQ
ncbi:MAG: VOC family protein [Pseudomonadota bacterium]